MFYCMFYFTCDRFFRPTTVVGSLTQVDRPDEKLTAHRRDYVLPCSIIVILSLVSLDKNRSCVS